MCMLVALAGGCLTTKATIQASMVKLGDAVLAMREVLPRDGNCMVVQLRENPYPLKIVMRHDATNEPMSKDRVAEILKQYQTCDELIVFNGSLMESALNGHARYLYPEQYVILRRAEKLQELGTSR